MIDNLTESQRYQKIINEHFLMLLMPKVQMRLN